MTTKIQELISLKKNIDKLQSDYELNFEEKKVMVSLDSISEWTKSEEIFSEGNMKKIPIHNINDDNKNNLLCFTGPPDSFAKNHKHPYDKLIICTKGLVRVVINNNEHIILKPLESVFIKKNVIHYVRFIDESEILILWEK